MNILYNTLLKLEGAKDNFRRVKVPGTLIERPRLYGSILSPLIPLFTL